MKTAEEYKQSVLLGSKMRIESHIKNMIPLLWDVVEDRLIAGEKTQTVTFQKRFGKPDEILKHFNEVGITFTKCDESDYDDDYTQYIMDISVLYNKENQ